MNADDLSASIMAHLSNLRQAAGYGPLPDMGAADRKMLFDALSRAIVEHIQQQGVVTGTVDTSQLSTHAPITQGKVT